MERYSTGDGQYIFVAKEIVIGLSLKIKEGTELSHLCTGLFQNVGVPLIPLK